MLLDQKIQRLAYYHREIWVKVFVNESKCVMADLRFSWRTPTPDDPQLKQPFEGFNDLAVIDQTGTAALIDFFPILHLLLDFVLPAQKRARELHKVEKQLYLSHWMK
jgi:hypothetical protein